VTINDLFKFLQNGGILAAALLVAWGGYKGYWIFGPQHDREMKLKDEIIAQRDIAVESLTRDRDYWRGQAWETKEVAKRTTRIVERAAER
jgi:hypothetical protein